MNDINGMGGDVTGAEVDDDGSTDTGGRDAHPAHPPRRTPRDATAARADALRAGADDDLLASLDQPATRGAGLNRRPDPARAALEARWADLLNRRLPEAARPDWPVRRDHCFARILLDHATGGVWYDAVAGRPARRHASDAILQAATALGEDVLAGRADLAALDARSLRWRGKSKPPRP